MEIKKEIQMSGNSAVIRLTAENLKLYDLKVGDRIFVEIETEEERKRLEANNLLMGGTCGSHVKTAEEKARDEELIAKYLEKKKKEKSAVTKSETIPI